MHWSFPVGPSAISPAAVRQLHCLALVSPYKVDCLRTAMTTPVIIAGSRCLAPAGRHARQVGPLGKQCAIVVLLVQMYGGVLDPADTSSDFQRA